MKEVRLLKRLWSRPPIQRAALPKSPTVRESNQWSETSNPVSFRIELLAAAAPDQRLRMMSAGPSSRCLQYGAIYLLKAKSTRSIPPARRPFSIVCSRLRSRSERMLVSEPGSHLLSALRSSPCSPRSFITAFPEPLSDF